MGSKKNYFTSLFKGIGSLLTGMSITGRYFFSRKITQEYPENRKTLEIPERFRATLSLVYDEEGNHKCIACGICQNNCPNNTIEIVAKKNRDRRGQNQARTRPLYVRSWLLYFLSIVCEHLSSQCH